MSIAQHLEELKSSIHQSVTLVAVSKTKSNEAILEAYQAGQRVFGENKAQEMSAKYADLPKDIQWHMIGHLQRNKVKYIAAYVSLIHSVDSLRLLKEINKEAAKNDRIVACLLQVYIAKEESKYGLDEAEVIDIIENQLSKLKNIQIYGLMGMATNTDNQTIIKKEFDSLKAFYDQIKNKYFNQRDSFQYLSMGMSGDYKLAIESGSNMIRVGSAIFGKRIV